METLEEEMEYSVHPPSPFITQSWPSLLPDWEMPVLSILVVLQRSPIVLCQPSLAAESMKQYLRDRSIQIVLPLVHQLRTRHYNAALFDPRTGLPYQPDYAPEASGMTLNDVAVVHAVLGYARHHCGQCYCIVHPYWGSNVYPTIMLSSTKPDILKNLAVALL